MTPWAQQFFNHPPYPDACQTCGLLYCPDVPEDRAQHRRHHRRVVAVFEPRPSSALAREFALYGEVIPVRASSPAHLRRRLYEIAIARIFTREGGYDFVLWSEVHDDGHGYLVADEAGRALGGAVVRLS